MERDFLGMSGKDSAREEAGEGRQDSVFRDNQVVQWPFSSKRSALKQFMTYNIGQEERAKLVYDQLASSGFQPITTNDAFEASRRASPVEGQQKCFAPDRQGVHPFPMHVYQSQSNASPAIPMHRTKPIKLSQMTTHNSVPVAPSGPLFTFHGSHNNPNVPEHSSPNIPVSSPKQQLRGGAMISNIPNAGSTIGGFTPRNSTKQPPMTAQLTMFYAGSVCVYDNMPSDTAQALMYLASKGSNASSNASNPKPVEPAPSDVKGAQVGFLSDIETQTKSQSQTQTQTQIQMVTQNQTQAVTQNQTRTPVASPRSGTPSPVSATSHIVSQTGGGSTSIATTVVSVGAKTIGTSTTNNHNEHSKTTTAASGSTAPVSVMPRAIPQARKASLARFLEKRKERVISVAPYTCTKNDVNDTTEFDGKSSKSSPNDAALPNNKEVLRNLGSPQKMSIDSGEYLSTKLHM